MNILLIRPYWPYPYSKGEDTYNRIWPPLSLANCAALLEKEGYKVEILDTHAQRIHPSGITRFIHGYDKIFVTSSSLDRWQCPNIDISPFLKTVRHIKEVTDDVYVMGYHGTVEPERILNFTGVKAVIRREPESTVLEICQDKDLFKIKGISFKDNEEFISTPERELLDLRSLPIPAFHLLDFKRYHYEILGDNFALFEIGRGCNYQCRFCNKVMYGQGLRAKSKEQIFEEVKQAIEKYRIKTGYFIDLDFLSNRKTVEELCDFLIKKSYNFKWTCQTRPDLLDIEILKKMKSAGCVLIHTGIETGSQESLDYLIKGVKIKKAMEAIKLCKKVGMKTLVFFLFGLPGETIIDRRQTLDFAKSLNPNFISFHKMVSYQGSELHRDNIESGIEADRFIRKALIEFYIRLSYLYNLDLSIVLPGIKLFLRRIRALR